MTKHTKIKHPIIRTNIHKTKQNHDIRFFQTVDTKNRDYGTRDRAPAKTLSVPRTCLISMLKGCKIKLHRMSRWLAFLMRKRNLRGSWSLYTTTFSKAPKYTLKCWNARSGAHTS